MSCEPCPGNVYEQEKATQCKVIAKVTVKGTISAVIHISTCKGYS